MAEPKYTRYYGCPTSNGVLKIEHNHAKYKWDFLRRNEEYISDWKRVYKDFIDKIDGMSDRFVGLIDLERYDFGFLHKWQVRMAINPACDFEALIQLVAEKQVDVFIEAHIESEGKGEFDDPFLEARAFVRSLMFPDYRKKTDLFRNRNCII